MIKNFQKLLGNQVQSLVPRGFHKPSMSFNQGSGQTVGAMDEFMGLPPLDAQPAL